MARITRLNIQFVQKYKQNGENMFEIRERIKIAKELKHTEYFWGLPSDITDKILDVLEKSKDGDCLCITKKGLVDVNKQDITEFIEI